MRKQILNRFGFVVLIGLIAGSLSIPATYYAKVLGEDHTITQKIESLKVTLGLDLAGGTELDYRIDMSEAIAKNNDDDALNDIVLNELAESVRDKVEQRVNPAGIGEIIVKRAQVNQEEHILVQMPPSINVEKAKRDAEKDNRLEFFEENESAVVAKRLEIAELITFDLSAEKWDQNAPEAAKRFEGSFESFEATFKDEMTDSEFADKLFAANQGEVIQEIIETTIQPQYTLTEDGELQFDGVPYPRQVLAVVRVTDKQNVEREKTTEAEAEARHILFAYPGALRAGEDLPYDSKEAAKAKGEEVLESIKNGADFAEAAKDFSTGPSSVNGGDLGAFGPGTMATNFNDAVFQSEGPQLIPDLIETDFGYHIIEVTKLTQETTQTVNEPKVTYEAVVWDTNDIAWLKTDLSGAQLDNARVGYSEVGQPLVDLRLNGEGGQIFAKITENLAARNCRGDDSCRLGIKVGGEWISQPYVHEKITGRNVQITGQFTYESAKALANDLELGAIDAPIILSGQVTVQPELGADQLEKSLKAASFGLIATILFMILMYRLAGCIAAISLILYTGIYIALLKLWPISLGGPIVLSLAGAAGIALSIGLAVDGNILIFERMKEEIRRGRKLDQAIDLGFERAWSAIRDSNLTTLITCIILFSLGSSVIKGFAITLIVGTLLSMFTAINVSRNLLRALLLLPGTENPKFFGVKADHIGKKSVGAKIRKRKSKS